MSHAKSEKRISADIGENRESNVWTSWKVLRGFRAWKDGDIGEGAEYVYGWVLWETGARRVDDIHYHSIKKGWYVIEKKGNMLDDRCCALYKTIIKPEDVEAGAKKIAEYIR